MSGAYTGKEINKLNQRNKGGLNSDRPVMLSEIVAIIQELSSGGTGFLKADGSIPMTGLLTLSGDPVNNLNPVTKQFLTAAITALVNSAPANLDTLGEIAAALGNDPNFASNLASQLTGINNDITNIKNYEFKILYYAAINSATGTITKPANSTIYLSDFPQGYDAVAETIINGEPSGEIAKTAGGVPITVTSFDVNGNYTLSDTPSSFPVALLYVIRVQAQYLSNLTFDNIIESQNLSAAQASNITFTPNGDIASTDVQSAIQEVRDDTDAKLNLKQAMPVKSLLNSVSGIVNTGNTNENIVLASENIVGAVEGSDTFYINMFMYASNNGNQKTARVYISDSDTSLLNAQIVATVTVGNNVATTTLVQKFFQIRGSLNAANNIAYQAGTGLNFNSGNYSYGTKDLTDDPKYLVLTMQNQSGADTFGIMSVWSKQFRP